MAALTELDVFVVDCQTTGATPALGHVIEIGWSTVRAASTTDAVRTHCVALPEGKRIPRVVSRLTGMTNDALTDALSPEAAWRALVGELGAVARTGGGCVPTAIHFARFELAFLRDLHSRFDPDAPFPFDVACIHEIAIRLYPQLPRRGLRALAGFLGHGIDLERRSGGHVEATAFVWRRLAAELDAKGIGGWDELKEWLAAPRPSVDRRRRVYPWPRERRLALPDEPGVYRMLRPNGDVLYVGKAASLRSRVSSHFTQGSRAGERALEMLTQVGDVAVTVTATALEAALLETDEIKRHDPPYNTHLRGADCAAWFASRDLARAAATPDADHPLGPFPSRFALSSFAALRSIVTTGAVDRVVRGRAVGAPPAFAPDETTFAAGWDEFASRHLDVVRSRTPWGRLVRASRSLWRLFTDGLYDEGKSDVEGPRSWDPARVRRHLERTALHGGQLLRRARWLCLLADASLSFREKRAASRRLIVLVGGEIAEIGDLPDEVSLPVPPGRGRSWRERQATFDGVRYDRLRVLATELKRVAAESGEVTVRLGEDHVIEGARLGRILRWV